MKKYFYFFILSIILSSQLSCAGHFSSKKSDEVNKIISPQVDKKPPSLQPVSETSKLVNLKEGLIAYYPFDDDSGGQAEDKSGNENHGKVYGAELVDGYIGKALKFNRKNSYVTIEDNDSLYSNEQLTIAAWVYMERPGCILTKVLNYGNPYSSSSPYGLSADVMFFYFNIRTSDNWNGTVIRTSLKGYTNKWVHLAGTYDGIKMKLYVDGKEKSSETKAGNIWYGNGSKLYIGGTYDYDANGIPDRLWSGKIDEVKIYNYALPEDKIRQLYNSQ